MTHHQSSKTQEQMFFYNKKKKKKKTKEGSDNVGGGWVKALRSICMEDLGLGLREMEEQRLKMEEEKR